MRTRIRLGISAFAVTLAAALAPPSQAAVSVFGGGLARSCYEAVEFGKVSTDKGIEICNLALEQEGLKRRDKAATLTNRGILYMRDGKNQRALNDYQRSLSLMPDLLETKVNLGAALYGLGRYTEALAALNEGILTDDVEARAVGFYNRALAHESLGDVQSAYEDFRRALNAKPDFKLAEKQLTRFTVETIKEPG
jgi:tetratricopeptide (TPR) repeat protein